MNIDPVGIAIGILGIVLAYVFYVKSLKNKEPFYVIATNPLIIKNSYQINELQILFREQQIENLVSTKIFFGNKGSDTIRSEDVANANPIRISVKDDVIIYDVKILKSSNDSSQFKTNFLDANGTLDITFDYIDYDQWVVIQVLHSDLTGANIKIIGDIKGGKKISYLGDAGQFQASSDALIIGSTIFSLLGSALPFSLFMLEKTGNSILIWVTILIFTLSLAWYIRVFFNKKRHFLKKAARELFMLKL